MTNVSDTPEKTTVDVDGGTWVAAKYRDDRYRLFKEDWPLDEGVRLPGEHGLCGYCLSENQHEGENPATLVCDDCGGKEVISHAERETVREVKRVNNEF